MGKEAIINKENKTVEFFVLSDISGYGTTSQDYFERILTGIGAEYTVKIYINSYGGDIKEALGISRTLKRCAAKVVMYVDCFACSAASLLLLGADEIYLPRNVSIMMHDASWWVYGNARQLRKSAEDLEVINDQVVNSYVMRCNGKLSREQISEMMAKETWVSAEKCVEYGIADGYSDHEIDIQSAANHFMTTNQTGAATYAKAPAAIAALLKPEQILTPEPAVPSETQEPQAGAPATNKSSLADKLLNAIKHMEV